MMMMMILNDRYTATMWWWRRHECVVVVEWLADFADLACVVPEEILFVFWDPAFDYYVFWINIEFEINVVGSKGLNGDVFSRHSCIGWSFR